MNFDLDTQNYNKEDYFDIFDLDKNMNITKSTVEIKYKNLLNNIKNGNLEEEDKTKMQKFLDNCKKNLLKIIDKETTKYKLIDSDFIPDLNKNETFNVNSNFIIKRSPNPEGTGKLNTFSKTSTSQLLNINTRFRKSYYETVPTDFILDLPEEFKNVISITVVNVQIPNSNYTFSSKLGTNEFSVELYDISKGDQSIINREKKTIKVTNGIYTGGILSDYLNTYVFSDSSLNRIGCKYDDITRKFRFFRDYRTKADGGLPADASFNYCFNIDWRLQEDLGRPIQLNMGWILGYRQQYYNKNTDYTDVSSVSYEKQEGYNPEAVYDNLGSRYFILCIDDFNKNYSNTLTSPFQESVFTDQNAIAKVPNNPNLINFDDIFYQSRRSYFGPVNIKKLHIKLMDEMGRIVDLNNNDFSFSLQIEQLYDVHAKNIYG